MAPVRVGGDHPQRPPADPKLDPQVGRGESVPGLAAGQVEGGVAQGIGWALLEKFVERDGRMANPTMTDYIVPTTMDTPPKPCLRNAE